MEYGLGTFMNNNSFSNNTVISTETNKGIFNFDDSNTLITGDYVAKITNMPVLFTLIHMKLDDLLFLLRLISMTM